MLILVSVIEEGFSDEQIAYDRRIWNQLKGAYGVKSLYLTPRNKLAVVLQDITVIRVFLIPEKTYTSGARLGDLHHPRDAAYIFGSNTENLTSHIMPRDIVVAIPTPTRTELFGCSAAAQVLYDRESFFTS